MGVIVCCGMNRSGSTLQYNVVRTLLESTGRGQAVGAVNAVALADDPAYSRWQAEDAWYLVKTHEPPPGVEQGLSAEKVRLTYIYRDIRTVAASYKRIWGTSGQRLLDELDLAVTRYNAIRALDGPILWQRYETVMDDLPRAVAETAEFLGLDEDAGLIRRVAVACSAETMQKVQSQLQRRARLQFGLLRAASMPRKLLRRAGLASNRNTQTGAVIKKRLMDDRTLLHVGHIGAPGASDAQLTTAEYDALTERYHDWLEATGYLSVPS